MTGSDYKPLTDEEITPLVEGMEAGIDNPPSYFWPHVLEQARRANALAESLRQAIAHSKGFITPYVRQELSLYLGETHD